MSSPDEESPTTTSGLKPSYQPSPEEIRFIEAINEMTHLEMANLWRYGPIGHVYFKTGPVFEAFNWRFAELGGFSPQISKEIDRANGG